MPQVGIRASFVSKLKVRLNSCLSSCPCQPLSVVKIFMILVISGEISFIRSHLLRHVLRRFMLPKTISINLASLTRLNYLHIFKSLHLNSIGNTTYFGLYLGSISEMVSLFSPINSS